MVRHSFKRQITSFFLLGPHELVPVCEYSDALTGCTCSGGVSSGMIGGVSGGVSDGLSGDIKDSVEGFSLVEVAVVLALVSLLIWLAVPRYSAQQSQGYSAAMQTELLACAQTLHGLELTASPSAENPWLTLADGDGDGAGDQVSGRLANDACALSPSTKRGYDVQVQGGEMGFVLSARPLLPDSQGYSGSDSESVWSVDHLGRQGWHGDGLAGSGL